MIKVGIAGVRGLSCMKGLNAIDEVSVEALCDLDESLLREMAEKYNVSKTYRIFEDMLESDIDAVIIATPMQCHVPQTLAALEAGKHVLCEVTAGVTMEELWWLTEAVEKYEKVYMLAENYCYIPQNQLIGNLVSKGYFGDIYFAEGEYIHDCKHLTRYSTGPDTRRGKDMNGKTSWRNYWHMGRRGIMYPTHSLGPLMQWFKGDRIKSVACYGTGWHTEPQFIQEDTSITMCQLESGRLIKLRLDVVSNRPHNLNYYSLQGTKGCYEAPRGLGDNHKIWLKDMDAEGDDVIWHSLDDYNEFLPERYRNATEVQKAAGHWGGDFFIIQDFIDAINKGVKPAIDVYDACEWTAVALLSELSVMNGGKSMEMPDFRNAETNSEKIIKL